MRKTQIAMSTLSEWAEQGRYENVMDNFSVVFYGTISGIAVVCDKCSWIGYPEEDSHTFIFKVPLLGMADMALAHYYECHYCDGCNHNAPHDCIRET
jgi:hypothetical protein